MSVHFSFGTLTGYCFEKYNSLKRDEYFIGKVSEFENELIDLMKEKDALNARIAALEEEQRWIPVSDLPSDSTGTYRVINHGIEVTANFDKRFSDNWHLYIPGVALLFQPPLLEVTHWRTLPPAPEEKK